MEPVGVRVQGLAGNDQVLALARLAETRAGSGGFTARGVDDLFHEFRLPAPARIDNVLTSLAKRGLVRKGRERGEWHVTPVGRTESEARVSGIDLAALVAEARAGGATLGGAAHHVILPEFGAPPELIPILREFLFEHEFSRNVFGMTRFPDESSAEPPDPVRGALEAARSACAAHGMELHLASDGQLHDDLWTNVAAYMWASRYGIGFFEDLADPRRGLNYNLTTEVGSMLIIGRRCALLKDPSIKALHSDLVGRVRKDTDLRDPKAVSAAIHTWLRDDLGLGPCAECGPAARK
jgi:hypothetical protein